MEIIEQDGLVFDPETGEILEWPSGSIDRMEYLIAQDIEADRNIAGWKMHQGRLRQNIGKMLDEAGIRAVTTPKGRAMWVSRTDRYGRPERLPALVQEFELSRDQEFAILSTAKSLDPKALEALNGLVSTEICAMLIETVEREPHIRIDPPRRTAPDVREIAQ